MTDVHNALASAAEEFISANAIAWPGDIVTTQWATWKHARRVRITRVGAHLVCRWNAEKNDWIIGFAMNYTAQRLRKDGSSAERGSGGICLSKFETANGDAWEYGGKWREEWGFNHAGLSWPRVNFYGARAQQSGEQHG